MALKKRAGKSSIKKVISNISRKTLTDAEHLMQNTVTGLGSSFSERLLLSWCVKEKQPVLLLMVFIVCILLLLFVLLVIFLLHISYCLVHYHFIYKGRTYKLDM